MELPNMTPTPGIWSAANVATLIISLNSDGKTQEGLTRMMAKRRKNSGDTKPNSAQNSWDLNLAGQVTITQIPTVLQSMANSQLLEAARQENLLHALVELIAKP